MLSVLDRKWREHLYEMDYLREGIGLRAYSQRDPLVEYQREGFDMFAAMMDGIKEESVGFLFNLEVQPSRTRSRTRRRSRSCGVEPLRARAARRPRRLGERPPRGTPAHPAKGLDRAAQPQHLTYSAPDARHGERRGQGAATATVTNADDPFADVGRNALCPCGSGKKYKRCHGAPGGPTGLTARIQ